DTLILGCLWVEIAENWEDLSQVKKGNSYKFVQVMTRVAWIRSLPPGSETVYDIGFEFVDLTPEIREELKTIFENASSKE
ncbi:MAG: hypothetical protein KAV87_32940, partial [Desulfobacteraceae bacterium]|nr:hypothetical protein [Desulfobacteraceae bacterium]